jgi:macrolide transport system ATP-binding/permease protein
MVRLFRKIQWWLQRRRREDDLREELAFHLAEEASERQVVGLPEDEAKWSAQRDLGNTGLLQEEVRALWSWRLLEQVAQDVGYTLRNVRRSPAGAITAILTLSVGIGAVTTMFAILYAVQLRELSVPDPRQLVFLEWEYRGQRNAFFSYPHWRLSALERTPCPESRSSTASVGSTWSRMAHQVSRSANG